MLSMNLSTESIKCLTPRLALSASGLGALHERILSQRITVTYRYNFNVLQYFSSWFDQSEIFQYILLQLMVWSVESF
jgi:hypothetical protein